MDSEQPYAEEGLAAISDGLTQLHTRYYEQGPTEARAHLVGDLVVCILWNGFTPVEQTLLEHGERGTVEGFRRTFQETMEEQFTEVVETATGRQVCAYMSQVHVDPNVAVEIFMLTPNGSADGSA